MKDFVFDSRTKTSLLILIGIGVVSMAAKFFSDDPLHMGFWGNWLQNTYFFTGIAAVAIFFYSAQVTAFAGWNALIKRLWESQGQFLIVGLLLFLPLIAGLYGHLHHMYHWNVPGVADLTSDNYDKIIAGKSGFLNKNFVTIFTILVIGAWYFLAKKMRERSIEQDEQGTTDWAQYRRIRTLTAIYMPVFGFTSVALAWLWMMSLDAHWYSTMYAWYSWASLFLAMISLTILMVIWLKSKGYLEEVTKEHLHDLGKYMFGISVFWTYLWFDQYMLIWYANIGEETIYFKERYFQYPLLHCGNVVLNFVLPFLILMRNDTKRKNGTLVFVAILVFLGHWWDFFQMVKPSTRITLIEHQMHESHGSAPHSSIDLDIEKAKALAESGVALGQAGGHTAPKTDAGKAVEQAKQAVETAADHAKDAAGHAVEKGKEAAQDAAGHVHEAAKDAAGAVEAAAHQAAGHVENAAGHAAEAVHAAGHAAADEHGDHGHSHEAALTPHGPKPFALGWTFPGFLELGTMLGFLGLFLWVVFSNLASARLKTRNDPYMQESEHHQVL